MVILSKKRLGIILSAIFVSLFAFSFKVAKHSNTVETVSLPVSNKVIVLDARTSASQMRVQNLVMELLKRKQI